MAEANHATSSRSGVSLLALTVQFRQCARKWENCWEQDQGCRVDDLTTLSQTPSKQLLCVEPYPSCTRTPCASPNRADDEFDLEQCFVYSRALSPTEPRIRNKSFFFGPLLPLYWHEAEPVWLAYD
ncbi:hypothetical protein TNCV_3485161 [Trichonephila clavipes]|nr:hypothetical protein TNCV_3485161 [Trichonephila clavipes]